MQRLFLVAAMAAVASAQNVPVLNQDEIQQLESKVAQNPEDRASQAVLGKNYAYFILGVTETGQYGRVSGVDPARAASAFAQHARDQLGNSLLGGVVGEGGNTLWNASTLVQVFATTHHLQDALPIADARALGVASLDRAVVLEPASAQWRKYRIPVLVLRSNFPETLPLTAVAAYAQVKGDLATLTGQDRLYMLSLAAKLAVRAAALDDAAGYAQEMLNAAGTSTDWDYGNEVFFGNMVLGQVALQKGDVGKAKTYLMASAKTTGSPQLNSFGPNMSLAKAMAEAGERQAVVDFLASCRSFWKMDRGRLQTWADEVASGRVPNFGANLLY